ncbi:MAG TPA: RNA methyltransferase [Dehalococcoidia bacterium]|nr:RNA methyltransferase [Dehalococcoidia bacterium]
MPIESPANQRVKLLRSLTTRSGRARERSFLVEGVRLIEAALAAGAEPSLVLYDETAPAENPRLAALLDRLPPAACWSATPTIIEMVSDTVTTQGIVAAFPLPTRPLPRQGIIVVADAIADPGNAGTLIRTAAAAGAAGLAYLPGTVDPFSPKVVRAGAGAHWQIPVARLSVEDLRLNADRGGWLAVARDGVPYHEVDWRPDGYLVVGSEAWGAREGVATSGFEPVTIPLAPGVESLNSAVAAAVLLFEARRAVGASNHTPTSRPTARPGRHR